MAADRVTRRVALGLALSGFGAAAVAFLSPRRKPSTRRPTGSFGAAVDGGDVDHVLDEIRSTRQPVYVGEGRFYLVEEGETVAALYQKCTHLGCRVPFCSSSQWFECACHASMFNRVGEWQSGPAPRGLDRFPVTIDGGRVLVDTDDLQTGPSKGTDTIGQEPAGPHCVGP